MLAAPPFSLLASLDRVDDAIDANADIAAEIVNTAIESLGGLHLAPTDWHDCATPQDLDKARSTITQFYRDWSDEGAAEREAYYTPVLDTIQKRFSDADPKRAIRILIPGAGLGRLVFELCRLGHTVEGNEISYHQLMASNWVLNHIDPNTTHDLYPFALNFSNLTRREDQMKCVKVPDLHPGKSLADHAEFEDRMSMTAGDFITLYGAEKYEDAFDAVASVFFVDTAPNIIRYIETVRNCLRVNGIWINLGPLLWHFADRGPPDLHERVEPRLGEGVLGIEAPGSFELTNEELLLLVARMGFEIEMHEIRDDGEGYIQNPHSLLRNVYRCSHWVARKKAKP